MKTWAQVAAMVLIATGVVLPEVVGFLNADYHFYANYLSELGAEGSDYARLVNYAGFVPVGLTVSLLVAWLWSVLPEKMSVRFGLVCLLGVSVGYIGAVLFVCEAGCPVNGGTIQTLHNLSGLAEYIGAAVGLALISIGSRNTAQQKFVIITGIAALLVATGFALMLMHPDSNLKGAYQRLADYSVFSWFCYAVASYSRNERFEGHLRSA